MKQLFLAATVLAGSALMAMAGQSGGQGNPGRAAAVQPVGGYWQYGSWQVASEIVDSVEEGRYVNCTAWTGGDGLPRAEVVISSLDVGPPAAFPSIQIVESAPRGHQTYMKDDMAAYLRFDDNDVYDGEVVTFYDDDGILNAEIGIHSPISQWVLQAMRRNGQMDIVINNQVFFSAFLDGFTASYLKTMEECGFDGRGVVN